MNAKRVIFLIGVLAFPSLSAHATIVPRLELPELVALAKGIHLGTVTSESVAWNEAHTLIFTTYNLEVTRTLKGSPTDSITLIEVGGALDGVALAVDGVPTYRVGEEAVVFTNYEAGRLMTL